MGERRFILLWDRKLLGLCKPGAADSALPWSHGEYDVYHMLLRNDANTERKENLGLGERKTKKVYTSRTSRT